ncbi:RNA-directed DNA polymerase from mobile element jockey-like [Elysia marginata]|uniref:RNA-directed DNA polymerase from mobile element jockey-like n=1 Tax=Elysia marginata TaxID=1093978 RepID=A0AAV4HXR2_9GAST|nr:RNA-directed DNA polymerase from mobile element jockey-like [Elysia marginata]
MLDRKVKEIKEIITDHFKLKFRDDSTEDIQPFDGQPRPLLNCITQKEVRDSINKLNNGRAPGTYNICNQYIKYAPPMLDKQIAQILNKTFESHEPLRISDGLLVTLPKPGKAKGPPSNLRPTTLLTSLRKILSTIELSCIRPKIEVYLPTSQSRFRPNRSTSDVIWAHRWLTAKVQKDANLEINVTGIDTSAAFDTINRKELLTILKEIVEENELHIIQFLLSETTLDVKVYPRNSLYHQHRNTTRGQSKPRSFHNLFVICSKRYQECAEQLTAASSLYAL